MNDEIDRYEERSQELGRLTDSEPARAIAGARMLPTEPARWLALRAKILCDAGEVARDGAAVAEAIVTFEELLQTSPGNATLAFNVANALTCAANLDQYDGPEWYLRTARQRRRARALFGQAGRALQGEQPI